MTFHPSFQELLSLVFPRELLEHFCVAEFTTADAEFIKLTFEELNTPPVIPEEHRGKRIVSKGFHRLITIQDFPIRDRHCLLTIKRRRWEIEGAGTLERTLSFLPEGGLKLTTDFAAFLKEADRTRTGGGRTHRETVLDD